MLMGIILSGKNGFEFKFLELYLFVVVDEFLFFMEFIVLNLYIFVLMIVKVVLLWYLCDIFGYFKFFYLLGYGGLRFCFYC